MKNSDHFDQAPFPPFSVERVKKMSLAQKIGHSVDHIFFSCFGRTRKCARILDFGCGTGMKAQWLAKMNVSTEVVAIDSSEKSIDIAEKSAEKLGPYENLSFRVVSDNADFIGLGTFDYINCDEVLYLVADAEQVLAQLRNHLNHEGLIRGNFHSGFQRQGYLRANHLMRELGVYEESDPSERIRMLKDTFEALQEETDLRKRVWNRQRKWTEDSFFSNHLLFGDKGYTVDEIRKYLEFADLKIVRPRTLSSGSVESFFKNPKPWISEKIENFDWYDTLKVRELIHPGQRLIDLYLARSDLNVPDHPAVWDTEHLKSRTFYISPLVRNDPKFKKLIQEFVITGEPISLGKLWPFDAQGIQIGAHIGRLLLGLLEEERKSFSELLAVYQKSQEYISLALGIEVKSFAQQQENLGDVIRSLLSSGFLMTS